MREYWKRIRGRYEDFPYEISNKARIRHAHTGNLITWRFENTNGYLCTQLHKDGERKTVVIHMMVAQTFLGPSPGPIGKGWNDWQVNHKNGDKTDPCPSNLEWTQRKDNHKHASENGLISHNHYSDDQVKKIWKLYYDQGKTAPEIKEIMDMPNTSVVTRIVNGERRRSVTKHLGEPNPRKVRGENMGLSKLRRHDVIEIRRLYATGDYTYKDLADQYNVNKTTIGRIINRQTWKHV